MTNDFAFKVDIEDSSGNKLGVGPLESVTDWQYTARMDRAGTFQFTFHGNDGQASLVQNRRIARAYAWLDGAWLEVGAGVIDEDGKTPGSDGRVSRTASGNDLITELRYRSVHQLKIGALTHSFAVAAIAAYAPAGWTVTADTAVNSNYLYARFDGESVLGALLYCGEKTDTHFYRGTGRHLIFDSSWSDSGIRAIRPTGTLLAPTECAITSITETIDTHDIITRIHPYGSGQGEARLTLRATTRSAPTGYTLNATDNYIQHDAAYATYGLIDFPAVEFKEITPIANTGSDIRNAANQLFDAAIIELRRRATLASQKTYTLTVAGCSTLLRPLQSMRVVYRDPDQGIDVDADLKILEATWQANATGVWTTRLVVSTDDRWPVSDNAAAAERAAQGRVFRAHPQLGPNSYWENGTLYIGASQADHVAEFPFVLGPEVTSVNRVRFRYKVDSPISFLSVGAGTADVSVTVDSVSVSVSGTIDISHTHPIPNHQHTFTVIGNGAGALTYDIGYGAGGTAGGMRHNIDSNDHVISTNSTSGATTSDGGGSETLSLSGATGTGTGSGSVDLSDAIVNNYGVYRASAGKTYTLSQLECRVNGGSWVSLDTGDDVDDGYYELDLTDDVRESDTWRPTQENNLIEIRRKSTAGNIAISSSQGDGTTVGVNTGATPHGLEVGDIVTITGTTYHDGTFTVVEVTNEYIIRVNLSGDSNTESPSSGILNFDKSAMILAKLGIVSSIQAVGLTD